MNILPRISARTGQAVDLNVTFYRDGIATDPYAIRRIEIYHTQVIPSNIVATIPFVDIHDKLYPSPAVFGTMTGAAGTTGERVEGEFHYYYAVPQDLAVPDVFFDLWYYFSDDPCGDLGSVGSVGCNIDDPEYVNFLKTACNRFWVYPDTTYVDDGLETIRFGFEPLDLKFYQPEARPLEVGLMPLPLYDYNFNLVQPIMPLLKASITVETQYRELLIDRDAMSIGVRQGTVRTNPWVLRYTLDTMKFLKGTYQYYITLHLPDASTRTSKRFMFTVS